MLIFGETSTMIFGRYLQRFAEHVAFRAHQIDDGWPRGIGRLIIKHKYKDKDIKIVVVFLFEVFIEQLIDWSQNVILKQMHICRKTYGEWILFQHSSAVASTLFLLSGRSFQLFLLLIPTNTFQIVTNMYIFNYFQLKRNKLGGLIFVGAPALWPLLGPMFPIVPVSGGAWGCVPERLTLRSVLSSCANLEIL